MDSQESSFDLADEGPLRVIVAGGSTSPSSIDDALIESEYKSSGALLLRGFEFDVDTFGRFAERLCSASVFNESRNRALIDPASNIQSVDLGTAPFPLHPELSREPWRPDVCLFACFDAPGKGGETTVCDGVEIVRRLPPSLAATMATRGLLYSQPASPEALEFWLGTATPDAAQLASPPPHCPYHFTMAGDRIVRWFERPLLHKPMFHEGPAFGNFLFFARYALRVPHFPLLDDGEPVPDDWVEAARQAAEPITHAVMWRVGDILILDNSRFMHGRRQILDPRQRKIASYFGYLRFAQPSEFEPLNAPWRKGTFRPPARPAGGTPASWPSRK